MISFKWKHFQKEIILLVVRWYLTYSLSCRDIEEMMLERGIKVDYSTIRRMDETYIKTKGKWCYFYRAVDKERKTIYFMLSRNRDQAAANAFFIKAIGSSGLPEKITIDKSGANKAGIDEINLQLFVLSLLGCTLMQIEVRQIKYLNNIIEQDHRGIKRITNPMMRFKAFHSAKATLAGIELCRMLKKGQHVDANNSTAFEQFYALAA
jgi:putative transposase